MRMSDWSSDVCSSDLLSGARTSRGVLGFGADDDFRTAFGSFDIAEFDIANLEKGRMRYDSHERGLIRSALIRALAGGRGLDVVHQRSQDLVAPANPRSEEHTSELQSLMRISYAVFCLTKKKNTTLTQHHQTTTKN